MPTVTEPIDPGQVLGKLDRLRQAIASALASEAELARTREQRRLTGLREITAREQQDADQLTARIGEINELHRQAVERRRNLFEDRRARIQQAYYASRTALTARMQEVKDQRLRGSHGELVSNRQKRKKDLADAAAAHQAFKARLAEDHAARQQDIGSARSALRSFRWMLLGPLDRPAPLDAAELERSPEALHAAALADLDTARQAIGDAHRLPLAKLFRFAPLLVLAALLAGVLLWLASRTPGGIAAAWPQLAISEGVLLAVWLIALALAVPAAGRIRRALATALARLLAARKASSTRVATLGAQLEHEEKEQSRNMSGLFSQADTELKSLMAGGLAKLDAQLARLPAKLDRLHQGQLARLAGRHEATLARARQEADEIARSRNDERSQVSSVADRMTDAAVQQLAGPWQHDIVPLQRDLAGLEATARARFPAWDSAICTTWTPPAEAPEAVRLGHLEVDLAGLEGGLPRHPLLDLPGPQQFAAPFSLGFPHHGSLLIETTGDPAPAIAALYSSALRLLASLPPGRASFVFIDPVGLGRGFAGLMHLSDYEETLITHRIWTQTNQIEERLGELADHIEKVIQMYLRNEYATIAEYNTQAGNVAEKYRFLVIAGFPTAFSETAARRLLSIASSGARCGVHLLIQSDTRQPAPDPSLQDELRRSCLRLILDQGVFRLADSPAGASVVVFDPPPSDEDATTLIHRIGHASIDSNRVEVPFAQIAPPPDQLWQLTTAEELRVPVGRAGAKKLQMLALGKGTRQHVLVAGKTGSGKSTLFHVIITNLALWCAPDQVEFYLVDFKKGVEFKCYATRRLPHARVIAIESDREFALSVLQQVDAELKRRGELFRRAGSQDLPSYNRSSDQPLPRSLLLIDEFQEFFTEDDSVAQEASLLLDRIVRQGRAFGSHVILGSQTLGGAYTLARATLGQMVVRVALQCNEADAHLIMDEENPAPRLLTRPGEGIYNDQAGAVAANSPFQIVWLPEQERDARLDQITGYARRDGATPSAPFVFEGNAPAEIRDNLELAAQLRQRPAARPAGARAWLGAPNSIKGPTGATFQRQSGSHLLAVGQASERTATLLSVAVLSLASQYAPGQVEFVVLDSQAGGGEGTPFTRLAAILPHRMRIGGPAEVPALMADLAARLDEQGIAPQPDSPEIYLIVHDLQRFKSLRPDDDFRFSLDDDSAGPNPSQVFANLLTEGGPAGLHVLASTDTWNNVSRWIPRKLLAEFEMRVLFQMSVNDSSNLIDSPAASGLGLHRALFHNEHYGTLETFRPYAPPDEAWLDEAAAALV